MPTACSNSTAAQASREPVSSEAGALIAQESNPGGLEAAYFAQLPGNSQWRTRPGAINSRNFAHLANFAAFPHGARAGRWGGAMARFKTTAGTAYDYIPHVDDVGMTVVFGRIGSGKSTWLMYVLAMFDQYLVDRDGIIFFFDKDRGGELLTRAVDGTYLVIRAGEASGLAPLKGLSNTPSRSRFPGQLAQIRHRSRRPWPIAAVRRCAACASDRRHHAFAAGVPHP